MSPEAQRLTPSSRRPGGVLRARSYSIGQGRGVGGVGRVGRVDERGQSEPQGAKRRTGRGRRRSSLVNVFFSV